VQYKEGNVEWLKITYRCGVQYWLLSEVYTGNC